MSEDRTWTKVILTLYRKLWLINSLLKHSNLMHPPWITSQMLHFCHYYSHDDGDWSPSANLWLSFRNEFILIRLHGEQLDSECSLSSTFLHWVNISVNLLKKTFKFFFTFEINKETSGLWEAQICVFGKALLVESRIPSWSKNAKLFIFLMMFLVSPTLGRKG